MSTTSKFQRFAKQAKCPNCAGELQLKDKRTSTIVCTYCGALSGFDASKTELILSEQKSKKIPPFSFLKVGLELDWQGIHYIIIGRTRWQSNYQEYWNEDGESGYEDSQWLFDEWILLSEYHTYLYVTENQDGSLFLAQSVYPVYPEVPEPTNHYIKHPQSGRSLPATEFGRTTLIGVEGESTYQLQLRESKNFWAYEHYSIEVRMEGKRIQEIEYYQEQRIDKALLLKGCAAYDSILKEQLETRERFMKHLKYSLFGGLIVLLSSLFVFSSSEVILEQKIPIVGKQITTDKFAELGSDSIAYQQFKTPVTVNLTKGIYELKISSQEQQWQGVELIYNKQALSSFEYYKEQHPSSEFKNEVDYKGVELHYYTHPNTVLSEVELQIIKKNYISTTLILVLSCLYLLLHFIIYLSFKPKS